MKKYLLGFVLGALIFIGFPVRAMYEEEPYSTVNMVTRSMVMQQEMNQDPSSENTKSNTTKEEPIPFRELDFNGLTVRKFVDPDNGNVCYITNYPQMSCVLPR